MSQSIRLCMLGSPTAGEQALLAETLKRPRSALTPRELLAESMVGGGFLLAVLLIWLLAPPGAVAIGPALACLPALVVSMRVRIDTPFGFTVPTQLAFVPLMFALPPSLVPPAVVLAMALSRIPDIVGGRAQPGRLVQAVSNSWFSIGP